MLSKMGNAAVIAAAGKGLRMGGSTRKQYLILEGKPVLARSVGLFMEHELIDEVVVVVPSGDSESVMQLLKPYYPPGSYKLVAGGESRQASIKNGLSVLSSEAEFVCIHDAARPLASKRLLESLLEAAFLYGAAVPVIKLSDTVKEINSEGFVVSTPCRENLRLVQTPQVFQRNIIISAYENAFTKNMEATDDAALVEYLGKPVATVDGDPANLKITSPRDLAMASLWLEAEREEG